MAVYMLAITVFQSYADQNGCRAKRPREGNVVELDEFESDENGPPRSHPSSQGRTPSGRKESKDRRNDILNRMFGSKYRQPDNQMESMGELMPLGKDFAIIAVMTH